MHEINGDPTAMAATAQQLTAPPMPGSVGRAGLPVNPPGLVEGFAMSVVDKMASVAAADYLAKVTGDIVTHAAKIHRVSIEYSLADITSAAAIVGASAKVANQGISLFETVTGGGTPAAGAAAKDEE